MTNGELFIVENPNIEFKLNGSCVWIYFDGVNHYTMPTEWWKQEISLFDKIKSEIESNINQLHENGERHAKFVRDNGNYIAEGLELALQIIDKYKGEQR